MGLTKKVRMVPIVRCRYSMPICPQTMNHIWKQNRHNIHCREYNFGGW